MKKAIEQLRQHGFDVLEAANGAEALALAQTCCVGAGTIGLGGSETVKEIGLFSWLLEQHDFHVFNQYEHGISMEENVERRRQGLLADLFITGSNAICETGALVNVDESGNRVAALCYGPKKVLIIAGKNKIVPDIEAGIQRINTVAAPKNVERVNARAISFHKEPRYTTENIQTALCILKKSREPGRITIILVDENLGY